jgi:TatD DNase family protein
MAASLVDFHCHLDLYPDPVAAVAQCEDDRVHTLAVTTTPRAWRRNRELADGTRYVRVGLGLHPQLVAERAGEIGLWEEYLPEARYVGEVGLDAGPRFRSSFELQKRVFERVLRACACEGGKILSVHSVRSAGVVLDMVESYLAPARGRVVLHWFSGSKAEALRAVALGCYFSINAEMLRNERQRKLWSTIPHERLLTETDGPFTRVGDQPTAPGAVRPTIEALANCCGSDPEAFATLIRRNLRALVSFDLSPPTYDTVGDQARH